MGGYWLYPPNVRRRRSRYIEGPGPGKWTRFIVWVFFGAVWSETEMEEE